mmetsp:Transcript_76196/g.154692  ORF Transcript_76196/g.154692 Transcript_76196/m.154692 type:complete len:85 (-) Transcript_76196:51-305(-)
MPIRFFRLFVHPRRTETQIGVVVMVAIVYTILQLSESLLEYRAVLHRTYFGAHSRMQHVLTFEIRIILNLIQNERKQKTKQNKT